MSEPSKEYIAMEIAQRILSLPENVADSAIDRRLMSAAGIVQLSMRMAESTMKEWCDYYRDRAEKAEGVLLKAESIHFRGDQLPKESWHIEEDKDGKYITNGHMWLRNFDKVCDRLKKTDAALLAAAKEVAFLNAEIKVRHDREKQFKKDLAQAIADVESLTARLTNSH